MAVSDKIGIFASRNLNLDKMTNTLIFIFFSLFLIALFLLGRWLYRRSLRLRNRLQMDRVFTNISHELLTPLTVISASVENLRHQDPSHANDYTLMELNIERMVRLLQQILETSKSQSGELKLLVSQGDVMQYIRQTAYCIEPLLHKQGQVFKVECMPRSMMGWIDTDKLDKIIYNLLSNAAKFTRPNGHVTLQVHTSKNYDHIIIKVIDDGIGMSQAQQKRLFRRFNDGDYRRMQVEGTGLGMALTRDLVFLHGGTIDCKSKEGEGTTFTVTLPITKEAFHPSQRDDVHPIDITKLHSPIIDVDEMSPTEPPQLPTIDSTAEDAYKLLLVEDNEELLMLMKTLLSSKYKIYTATSGHDALETIKRQPLDMIISDVMMPQMDGNELTRIIKSSVEWNHLPVILLTAKNREEDRKQSMLIGADDYITKPFKLGDLELRIDNIIKNRKRIMESMGIEDTSDKEKVLTPDELFLQQAYNCVVKNMSNTDFDRNLFASEMGASSSTLYNKLKSITGQNVTTFIRDIRMKEAKRLVETQPELRVSDIAYKVGFKDPKYFATCFKKEFGVQPSEYIESFSTQEP